MKFALNFPLSRKVVFTGIDKRYVSYLHFQVKGLEEWTFALRFDFGLRFDSSGTHKGFCIRGYASKGTDWPVFGRYEVNKTLFNYKGNKLFSMEYFDHRWKYILRAITQLIKRIDARGYLH